MQGIARRVLIGIGAVAAGGAAPPARVTLRSRLTSGHTPFRGDEFNTVGVFDADWLGDARYRRLLDTMAASPGAFGGVRVFGTLNAGSRENDFPTASGGTWRDPAQQPDFAVALGLLHELVSRRLTPFLALTFFPPAVSPHPITPPPDFTDWERLVAAFLDAASARFGAAEIARWWFEAWNEPNMPQFWRDDFDRYLGLYRATAAASAGRGLKLGGPAIAWLPDGSGPALMERFVRMLAAEPGLPCDFLSFHRKGVWDDDEGEPRIQRLVEAAEATAELALRIVPERCARGLAIINNEADMRVGFQRPYAPRMSERFPSWLAALAAAHAALSARHSARGLRFMAFADNANQHLMREPFDGRRALMSPAAAGRPDDLIKLPVFAFYEMLRMLGGELHGADQPVPGLFRLVTADAGGLGAMLTLHPDGAGTPLRLEWTLDGIPWRRVNVAVFRVDGTLSNAFAAAGGRVPAPPIESADARRLRHAAELALSGPVRHGVRVENGRLALPLRLTPFATVLAWITPFRTARPAAPRRLEAEMADGNAVLRWAPAASPDILGYEVSRLGPERRIAPMPLRAATWVDTAPEGAAPRYGVRAVSTSGVRGALVTTTLR